MNWGTKIFLTLLLFIIVAVSTGVYMVSQDHDSLVEDDYYEKGLTFDSEYDRKENVEKFNAEPEVNIVDNELSITFQQNKNVGTLQLQRASDSSLDRHFSFSTESKQYNLPLENLSTGKWKLLINWKHDETSFMHEKIIYMP